MSNETTGRNIEKAIEEEAEYIRLKNEGVEQSLLDRLLPYGYTTLDEYFSDKVDYQVKHMGFIITEFDDSTLNSVIIKCCTEQTALFGVDKVYSLTAWVGTEDPFDEELAKSLGCTIHRIPYTGGIIIGDQNDLHFGFIFPVDVIPVQYFRDKIGNFLYEKCGVIMHNNDFMQDGKKVAAYAYVVRNGICAMVTQFSFVTHEKEINALCVANPDKPVGVLTGVTRDEILDFVRGLFK